MCRATVPWLCLDPEATEVASAPGNKGAGEAEYHSEEKSTID